MDPSDKEFCVLTNNIHANAIQHPKERERPFDLNHFIMSLPDMII